MQAVDKIAYSNNWITILFLILFMGIVLLKLIDAKKMKESFFAFSNFSLFEEEDMDVSGFFSPFQIIIYLFSVTVLSVLVYQFKVYQFPEDVTGFSSFLSVFSVLFVYFLIKKILEYLLMVLFMIKNKLQFFKYLKNNYLYSLSFLMYVALIFAEYSTVNYLYVFFLAIFLFFLRFVFLVVRNKNLIFNKLFYFILYICALEIAPLFVLFKLMF